jgi:hypothetical protein
MGTNIRPVVSEKNPYWIEKHRYYELKHFCLQYPLWRKQYDMLQGLNTPFSRLSSDQTNEHADPTVKCAISKMYYSDRIVMIHKVASETNNELCDYILRAVTEGLSYDTLRINQSIPCCRDVYYELYRRFFWILNKIRQ